MIYFQQSKKHLPTVMPGLGLHCLALLRKITLLSSLSLTLSPLATYLDHNGGKLGWLLTFSWGLWIMRVEMGFGVETDIFTKKANFSYGNFRRVARTILNPSPWT